MRLGVDRGPSVPANTVAAAGPRRGAARPASSSATRAPGAGTRSGTGSPGRSTACPSRASAAASCCSPPRDAGRAVACEVRAGLAVAASAPVTVGSDPPPWTPEPRRTAAEATPQPTPTPTATPEPTATPDADRDAEPTATPSRPDAGRDRRRRRSARAHRDGHAHVRTAAGRHAGARRARSDCHRGRSPAGRSPPLPLPDRVAPRVTIRRSSCRCGSRVSEPVDRHREAPRQHADVHARRRPPHALRPPADRPRASRAAASRSAIRDAAGNARACFASACDPDPARSSTAPCSRARACWSGARSRSPTRSTRWARCRRSTRRRCTSGCGRGSRTSGATALTEALHERTVVQGTLMRSTIHLVSRADYWPLALADPRRAARLVAAGHEAARARRGRRAAARGAARRTDEARRDRGADRQARGARRRHVARPRARPAVGHVGAPPRRSLRPRRDWVGPAEPPTPTASSRAT